MTAACGPWRSVVCVLLLLLGCSSSGKAVAANPPPGGTPCTAFTDTAGFQAGLRGAQKGTVITLCGDIVVNSTLQITVPMTLQGATTGTPTKVTGNIVASNGHSPLFFVADGVGPVAFMDLDLQNPNPSASYYGGAVQVGINAAVSFTHVVFRDNVAEYGGAVYSRGNISVFNCAFVNNTAYGGGGAIYTDKAGGNVSLSVLSTSFLASAAGGSGGAIYFDDTGGILQIVDSTFVGSAANEEGGAVYLAANGGSVMTGNSFLNGSAGSGGGALFIAGDAYLAGNNFTGNTAPIGGAVYTDGSINTAFCGGDRFTSNVAQSEGYGNAVFVQSTPNGDGTAFCPSVPLEVDVAGDPVAGLAVGSCLNCDPSVLCSQSATGALLPALQPTGVACSCNPGFYGDGFACYPVGSNLSMGGSAAANLTSGVNLTALYLPVVVASRTVNTSTVVSPLSVTEGEVSRNSAQSSNSGPLIRAYHLPLWFIGLLITLLYL